MKVRGVMARKGDTPKYISKMQQELFEILAGSRNREDIRKIEPEAWEVHKRYIDRIGEADTRSLPSIVGLAD